MNDSDAGTVAPTTPLLPEQLPELNLRLAQQSAEERLEWAWAAFAPLIVASSSFQTQSLPLLHMVSKLVPDLEICFLDTGYHFPQTIAFRDRVAERLGLRLRVLRPGSTSKVADLYHSDPDQCCFINKVEPMERALRGQRAWVTGIRWDQTATRRQAGFCERRKDGLFKIAPLLDWTSDDIAQYVRTHDLPTHPLTLLGFASIGCAPCTRAVASDEDDRAGRWSQLQKTECGLHFDTRPGDRS